MKQLVLMLMISCLFIGVAFAESIVMTNSGSGYDSDPTVVSITSTGAPAGATITNTVITSYMGGYIPSWYNMHLTIGGVTYNNVGNLTNAAYYDLNGQSANGQVITITSIDNDAYADNITMSLTVEIFYVTAGAPGVPTNPIPASGSAGIPLTPTLTWNFGADTSTYDLWFGPTGSMVEIVSGATASGSGSYTPPALAYDTSYSWQVISHNATRMTTSGPIWNFRTALGAGLIQVGFGTSDLNLPIYPYYGYTYSQSIFLQSEINMPGQRIDRIWYYWNGAYDANVCNSWVVYMGHTSLTSFGSATGWIPLSNLTQVFAGDVTIPAAAGWIEIILTTPFLYNNTDNLVICVDENEPGYNASNGYFFSTTTPASRSLFFYSDGTNPDPVSPPSGTLRSGIPNIRMHFIDLPTGPPLAPTLTYPLALTGLPKNGFNLAWNPNPTSGPTDYYNVYLWNEGESIGDGPMWSTTGTTLNPTAPPLDPLGSPQTPLAFNYEDRYYWTVEAYSAAYPSQEAWPVESWFEIEPEPIIITTLPYVTDFEAHADNSLPAGWERTTLGTGWIIGTDYSSAYWGIPAHTVYACANDDASNNNSSMDILMPPLMNFGVPAVQLSFDSFYTGAYSQLAYVEISVDGGPWTNIFNVPAAADWTNYSINLSAYASAPFRIRFHADDAAAWASGWAIDNVVFAQPAANDVAIDSMGGFPALQQIGTTYYPTAVVMNNGTNTQTFSITLSIPTGYSSTQPVDNLLPGASTSVNFAPWTPVAEGPYSYTCEAPIVDDANPADNTLSGTINVFDSVWSNNAVCPVGSYMGSAASYVDGAGNGHIIANGGNTSTTLNNEVYDYNVNTNTWTYLSAIPSPRLVHASAIVGNYLYVIGGSDGTNYYGTNYRYDLVGGGGWTIMSPLPGNIAWGKAVHYQDNYIYLAGGYDGSNVLSSMYLYNISSDTWQAASPLPGPLFGGAFTITGNTLVYVAGADLSVISNTVYAGVINPADPTSITWSSRASYPGLSSSVAGSSADLLAMAAGPRVGKTPLTRTYPAGSMYRFDGGTWGDDGILVAGGSPGAAWTPADPCPAYVYKPSTDTWLQYPNLNSPVLGAYMNTVKSSPTTWNAVVASGYNGSTAINTTQILTKTIASGVLPTPVVTIAEAGGTISLDWAAVPGATGGYRIEFSDSPYGPWTDTVVVGTNSWSGAAVAKKFYRVIALP